MCRSQLPVASSQSSSRPLQVAGYFACLLLSCGCVTTEQDRANKYSADGLQRFRQGDYQGAREDFEAALALKPEDINLLYNVGQCYERQGDWAQAEKWYRQCLEKSDRNDDCRHALIAMLYRVGRKAEADGMIRDWLAQAPDRPGPWTDDGWRLRQLKNYPQAQARFQRRSISMSTMSAPSWSWPSCTKR